MLFCQGQKQILELAQLQLFLGLVGLPSLTEGQRCLNGKRQSLRLLRVLLCLNEDLLDFGNDIIFGRALANFFLLEQLLAAKNMCLEDHRLICLVAAATFQLCRLLKGIFDLLQYRVALLQVTDSLLELIVQGLTDFGLWVRILSIREVRALIRPICVFIPWLLLTRLFLYLGERLLILFNQLLVLLLLHQQLLIQQLLRLLGLSELFDEFWDLALAHRKTIVFHSSRFQPQLLILDLKLLHVLLES